MSGRQIMSLVLVLIAVIVLLLFGLLGHNWPIAGLFAAAFLVVAVFAFVRDLRMR